MIRELPAPCRTEFVFYTSLMICQNCLFRFSLESRPEFTLKFVSGIKSIQVPVFGGIRSSNTDFTFRLVVRLANIKYQ